jgi:hypothetical protein
MDKLVKDRRRKKKYLKVMKMLILIRNTIHNNGVYFPISKLPKDKQATYGGIKCRFKVGKKDIWNIHTHKMTDVGTIFKTPSVYHGLFPDG